MEQIILTNYLDHKLKLLIEILYNKEYFGFKESAIDYVDKIYDFIYSIPNEPLRKCKNFKYGKCFTTLKMNDNTTYYITFDVENSCYIIKNIFNNHEEEYPIYIQ